MTEEKKAPEVLTQFNGVEIWLDEARHVNLNQMHLAAGSPPNRDPREWRRKSGRSFIADLARNLNVAESHIMVSRRGKGGSTVAHWQIALAYAAALSTEFHRHINEVFREWKREEADPDLKYERLIQNYMKRGMTREQAEARVRGTGTRKAMTSAIARAGCREVADCNPYRDVTNILQVYAAGETPAETRERFGLGEKGEARDVYSVDQALRTENVEHLLTMKIRKENLRGNGQVLRAAATIGEAHLRMMKELGLA